MPQTDTFAKNMKPAGALTVDKHTDSGGVGYSAEVHSVAADYLLAQAKDFDSARLKSEESLRHSVPPSDEMG